MDGLAFPIHESEFRSYCAFPCSAWHPGQPRCSIPDFRLAGWLTHSGTSRQRAIGNPKYRSPRDIIDRKCPSNNQFRWNRPGLTPANAPLELAAMTTDSRRSGATPFASSPSPNSASIWKKNNWPHRDGFHSGNCHRSHA